MLVGFKSEQLEASMDNSGIIKLSGKTHFQGDTWKRFNKEINIPKNRNKDKISAKFSEGVLSIKMPKKVKRNQLGRYIVKVCKEYYSTMIKVIIAVIIAIAVGALCGNC